MAIPRITRISGVITLLITIFSLSLPAYAKYSGGTGEPVDPYLIYTAEQMNTIGAEPNDWDKHFKLMENIDLSSYVGGDRRPAFNIIGRRDWPFTGTFDGNSHTISHLVISGEGDLGLFGILGHEAEVNDLGVVDINITGSGNYVGGLVGESRGIVTNCYSTGTVNGDQYVGGLVGYNGGRITMSYSNCIINGSFYVGGFIGLNSGIIAISYCNGMVSGVWYVGGLLGINWGSVFNCYSKGVIKKGIGAGGLVGHNWGSLINCYSTGTVSGVLDVGGLVGSNDGNITGNLWDIETSGQSSSAGGMGRTTAEMQDINTYLNAGWDIIGKSDGPSDIWAVPADGGYPVLYWQLSSLPELPTFSGGTGEPNEPYLITTADELNSIGYNPRLLTAHFKLISDIDLAGIDFYIIGCETFPFSGDFDGNGHTISSFTYDCNGIDNIGLFAHINRAQINSLGLIDPHIDAGTGGSVGSLVGALGESSIDNCYSQGGMVSGGSKVGGLAGYNWSSNITYCYSTSSVSGIENVGGLVGYNSVGNVTKSYSTGSVEANDDIDLNVKNLYILTKSGIFEISFAGEQRLIVDGHYDSYAIKIKDDILYVTEKTRGGDIVAYDLEGHYLRAIPTPPQADDYLTFVALPDDKFALLANRNDKVFFIDNVGNLIATMSIGPIQDNWLQNLDGIVVDNKLVISEDGYGQVVEIDLNTYEMSVLPYWTGAIAYANETYYIARSHALYAFTESRSAVQVAEISGHNITGIVVIDDFAYIPTNFTGELYKVDLSSGETSVLVSGINYPKDIAVSDADRYIGGFIGYNCYGDVTNCFWDTGASGQDASAGGTGKATSEMQTASTFLDVGWDFVDEVDNGIDNIWWIDEGNDYPRLWWELIPES